VTSKKSEEMKRRKEEHGVDEEINWDTGYGDASYVSISMLTVIHMQRLNSNK
jgi:hypothetical protein